MKKGHIKTRIAIISGVSVLGLAGLGASVAQAASSATATTKVNVKVGSVISLTAPSSIDLTIDAPAASGTFGKASGTVSVTTNSRTGYKVYITSNDETTSLTQSNVSTSFAAGAGTNGAMSAVNTWGWSSDGSTFNAIQKKSVGNTTATLFASSSSAATSTATHTLTIGANADSTMVSGTYTGTILLTAVTNE